MLTNPNWKLIHHKSRFKVALVNENQWSQLIFMYETNDGAYLEKNCKTIQLILHHKNSKQNDVLEKKFSCHTVWKIIKSTTLQNSSINLLGCFLKQKCLGDHCVVNLESKILQIYILYLKRGLSAEVMFILTLTWWAFLSSACLPLLKAYCIFLSHFSR